MYLSLPPLVLFSFVSDVITPKFIPLRPVYLLFVQPVFENLKSFSNYMCGSTKGNNAQGNEPKLGGGRDRQANS